jgi:hypothetical protein
MGKSERQAHLKAIRSRYRRSRKKVKVTILDEFCSICGYNRKNDSLVLRVSGNAVGDGVRYMCEFFIRRCLDPAKLQPESISTVDVNTIQK